MPVLFSLYTKIAPFLKYIVFAAISGLFLFLWLDNRGNLTKSQKELELYQRQVSGQLSVKEHQLEEANDALGIAQSKLQDQSDLLKSYQEENIKVNADLEKFKKTYNVQLESYQRTIASLQEQLSNRDSTVVTLNNPRLPTDPKPDMQFDHLIDPAKEKVSYAWQSGDDRFSLYDPDIFVSNTVKTFKLNQSFRVTGEIYKEKNGFLKTQRLTLEEVIPNGQNKDGTTQYKTVGTAKLVDSKFNYSEQSPDAFWPKKGIFGIWPVISVGAGLDNGLVPHLMIGTGLEFISWKGLGLGTAVYLDTNTFQDSSFAVQLSYRPTIIGHQLNVGGVLGVGTQFRAPFQSMVGMTGVQLYLW